MSELTILIVDDAEINRILLREIVIEFGFSRIYEAEDGESAIQIAQQYPPDIVLLDVVLPGMSGYSVAPKLKALSPECFLPVVFITSLDDKDSIVMCFDSGGDDFI